jgi:steroid delta-isomerase
MIPDLAPLIRLYETLSPESVDRLGDHYAADAAFKDPFNEVRGIDAIARIFRHMFVQVADPRFVVTGRFSGEDGAMLLWEFHFRACGPLGRALCARGASHLRFDAAGKVTLHRDYWDAAEELYAKLPVLGCLMRGLQRLGRS